MFGFALILDQGYNTTEGITRPIFVGKRRVGRAWQLEGMSWKCEQGERRDCYLAEMIRV